MLAAPGRRRRQPGTWLPIAVDRVCSNQGPAPGQKNLAIAVSVSDCFVAALRVTYRRDGTNAHARVALYPALSELW